jgi:hypothetical protein
MNRIGPGKPPTRFLKICPHINGAYATLRKVVKEEGYVPPGNNGSSVEQYALGYIREIAARYLPDEKIRQILGRLSDKNIWSSAGPMQSFVPLLVQEVIDSGKLTSPQFVELINDRTAFRIFADHKKANPGSRASGI